MCEKPSSLIDSRTDRRDAAKLTEVCKEFLLGRYVSTVQQFDCQRPAVRFYSSDATPILVNKSWKRLLSGHKQIVRHGKRCMDVMCERCFVRGYDQEGHVQIACVIRDPFALTNVKIGWALFACEQASGLALRACGFTGPSLSNYCFDRGCCSILEKLIRQSHVRRCHEGCSDDSALLGLLDFVFVHADILHDICTGFMTAMRPFAGEGILKNLWIGIASVRHGYDLLMTELLVWLAATIDWTDLPCSSAFCATLWACFSIE